MRKMDALEISKAIRRAIFVYEGVRLHAQMLSCPVIPRPWNEREEEFKLQFTELVDDLIAGRRKFSDSQDLASHSKLDPKERVKDDVFLVLVNIAGECIW